MYFFGNEANYDWQSKTVWENLMYWQLKNGHNLDTTIRAYNDIEQYGYMILESDIFAESFNQEHHKVTTVGEHTLHVAFKALEIAYKRQEKQKYINIEYVVQAALLHDLGIIGRYEKYANNLVSCYMHPIDSANIVRERFPYMSYEVISAVENHMFPATPIPPTSPTGLILIMADKAVSVKESRMLFKEKALALQT